MTWVAAIIMSVVLSGATLAQTVTDVELKAAYCLGVSTFQYSESSKKAAAQDKPALRKLNLEISEIIDERRLRFRDYLIAKGFLAGRDANSIKGALRRGPADAEACGNELEEPFFKQCSQRCRIRLGGDEERITDCIDRCPAPDACTRVKTCLQNFLPF